MAFSINIIGCANSKCCTGKIDCVIGLRSTQRSEAETSDTAFEWVFGFVSGDVLQTGG
jgi:hypothetical protein